MLRSKRPQGFGHGLGGVQVGREEIRRIQTRGSDRRAAGFETRVLHQGRAHEVQLINVSDGGAMIGCDLKARLCDRVELQLAADDTVECLVRWVKEGRIGLEFAHETQLRCSDAEQKVVLRAAIDAIAEIPSRDAQAGTAPQANKRSSKRHPLIWFGELHCASNSWSARLRNVSETGALVQCSGPLKPDQEVMFDLKAAGSLWATVSWVAGDLAGIAFQELFDMRLLARSKPRMTAPTWVRPAYLAMDVSADSAWEDAWNRASLDDLRDDLEGFLKR